MVDRESEIPAQEMPRDLRLRDPRPARRTGWVEAGPRSRGSGGGIHLEHHPRGHHHPGRSRSRDLAHPRPVEPLPRVLGIPDPGPRGRLPAGFLVDRSDGFRLHDPSDPGGDRGTTLRSPFARTRDGSGFGDRIVGFPETRPGMAASGEFGRTACGRLGFRHDPPRRLAGRTRRLLPLDLPRARVLRRRGGPRYRNGGRSGPVAQAATVRPQEDPIQAPSPGGAR